MSYRAATGTFLTCKIDRLWHTWANMQTQPLPQSPSGHRTWKLAYKLKKSFLPIIYRVWQV